MVNKRPLPPSEEEDSRFSKLDLRSDTIVSTHKTTFTPYNAEPAATIVLGELTVELEQAGDDQVKRLDVLLNHLEQKSISKTEFIEKITAKPENKNDEHTSQQNEEPKEHLFEVHEEENFEVEIEDEAIAFNADEEEPQF